jgi:hypothetical protein
MSRLCTWLSSAAPMALALTLLSVGTGCGALKAAANPKVGWALNDPAPMSVVVRRAEVAERTAIEVDRLMTATAADKDAAWLGKVAPEKSDADKRLAQTRKHALYQSGARVVAAEYWAKALADLDASQPAAPVATVAPATKAPAAGKKAAASKKDGTKEAPTKAAKAAPAEAKPAPAEAKASGAAAAATSLFAHIDKDLASAWAEVMTKKKDIGARKGEIALLEAKNDEKSVPAADKKANEAKIKDLEKEIDALEKDASQLTKAFLPKAKAAAKATTPEVREKLGLALASLRQAVDDANVANGAAAVRYPLAARTLPDGVKEMAAIYVADVIEERTGKRPTLQGLVPGVTLEGGDVQLTINGLSANDLGKLTVPELTKEVAGRTTAWMKRAIGLLGAISATKEVLSLEEDVLEALLEGFTAAGWKAPPAVKVPDAPAAGAASPRG